MRQLYHTHLSPFCRKIRMLLKEKGLEFELVCENPWDRKLEFFALNPAGEVPVLVEEDGTVVSSAYAISEYLEDVYPQVTLIGTTPAERAEVRRLADWFDHKFDYEVTQNILFEKMFKHYFQHGGEPNSTAIRTGKNHLLYHLDYIGYLAGERYFLACDQLTLADLAAAAHLSALDYLGDVPWDYNLAAQQLVCADEIAPEHALHPHRARPRRPPAGLLRKSGFLIQEAKIARARLRRRRLHRAGAACGEAQAGLQEFIASGRHGDMHWMEDKADRRADPKTLWPEVESIIVLGHNYGPDFNPMEKLQHKDKGNISCYALNRDYHDVIKKKLKQLARWIAATYGCEVKVFVDTAPVMEKPLATAAGIGWQGKHTCVVSREFGSWLFLGSIFTNLVIPSEADENKNHCGTCTKCLDICPTQAFDGEGKLDARKCIAYLTIEHKGQIPLEFRKAIGNRIYGCDDCLAVCPWNKFARVSKEMAYHPRRELEAPLLRDLAQLDDATFRALFSKSPVKRIGRDRFVRNVLIAIGNSGDATLGAVVEPLRQDASPLVAEMAGWALNSCG